MKIRKSLIFILVLFTLIIISISAVSAFGLPSYSYTPPTTYKPPTTYNPPTYKPPTTYTTYQVNYANPTPPTNFNSPTYASDYQKYQNAKAMKSWEDEKKRQQQLQLINSLPRSSSTGTTSSSSSSSSSSKNSKLADLTITKMYKKGNTYSAYIQNIGDKTAGKSKLGIYDGKKLIKQVNVKSIGANKATEVKVTIPAKYKNKYKTFKVDSTNKIKESNEKNNNFKAK